MVQWLRLCASIAGGTGSIPGRGTTIPSHMLHGVAKEKKKEWNSLAVQWLGLHTSTDGVPGSMPGQGTKILQATW